MRSHKEQIVALSFIQAIVPRSTALAVPWQCLGSALTVASVLAVPSWHQQMDLLFSIIHYSLVQFKNDVVKINRIELLTIETMKSAMFLRKT